MEEALEGMETTRREGLEWTEEVSGQEGCRVESLAGKGWTAETGNGGYGREGQERASATTFWEPGRWTMLLVNSKMKDRCLCWTCQPRRRNSKQSLC